MVLGIMSVIGNYGVIEMQVHVCMCGIVNSRHFVMGVYLIQTGRGVVRKITISTEPLRTKNRRLAYIVL